MTGKTLLLTAGVALVVVLAHDAHKGGKLPNIKPSGR
jgi:hypothetical protein